MKGQATQMLKGNAMKPRPIKAAHWFCLCANAWLLLTLQAQANDGFSTVRITPSLAHNETVMGALAPLIDDFPGDEEGSPRMEITLDRIDGAVHFEIIETGFADDAVAGEHHRGIIIRTDDQWQMIELSVKPICARGDLSAEGLCP